MNGHMKVQDMKIEILQCSGKVKYLGRNLCLTDSTAVEIEHRIAAAWKKFGVFKEELTI